MGVGAGTHDGLAGKRRRTSEKSVAACSRVGVGSGGGSPKDAGVGGGAACECE